MSRWTSAANQTAAAARAVDLVILIDLDIPTGRIRAHNGYGTLTWDGHEWLGVGVFGAIEAVNEQLESLANGIKLTLSGVETALITDAMEEQYHRQPAVIYTGLMNPETGEWTANPEVLWDGFMDVMTLEFDSNSARIELSCEHDLFTIPTPGRMNTEDQKARFAGDLFLDFLPEIPGYAGKWGAKNVYGGGSPSPPRETNYNF